MVEKVVERVIEEVAERVVEKVAERVVEKVVEKVAERVEEKVAERVEEKVEEMVIEDSGWTGCEVYGRSSEEPKRVDGGGWSQRGWRHQVKSGIVSIKLPSFKNHALQIRRC